MTKFIASSRPSRASILGSNGGNMGRSSYEMHEDRKAGRSLFKADRRVFYFSSDCLIDVCPSERNDAAWITIASQTMKPRSEHISIDGLADFINGYELSAVGLYHIDIPCKPRTSSPFMKQGRWGSLVYFIQGVDGGQIKIGFSTNFKGRITTLQASSPVMLKTISCFPATQEDENGLHNAFKYCHSHFEWFFPDEMLQLFSKSLCLLYPQFSEVTADIDEKDFDK